MRRPQSRPQEREREPSPVVGDPVTTSELVAQHLGGASARAVGDRRRNLLVRGVTVATVGPDPAAITPMCAVSARDLPVVDILAALAAQDPTGVLVIEAGDQGFAFEVIRGRLTGARGTGPLDRVESFVAEVHRKQPDRFGPREELAGAPTWLQVARTFVEERVLDQLKLCLAPGARMTLVRGDVEWVGTRLPDGVGPSLAHVLLEHARRSDEAPRMLATLGSLDRVAIPMTEPGQQPVRPQEKQDGEGWDFFDDPDPAAMAEWEDARRVWTLCDGEMTLAEVIDAAMIGQFRAVLALHTLVVAKHLVLLAPEREQPQRTGAEVIPMRPVAPAAPTPQLGSEAPALRVAEIVEPAPDPEPDASGTAYSMVMKRVRPRRRETPSAPPRPPTMYFEPTPPPTALADLERPAAAAQTRREPIVEAAAQTRREPIVAAEPIVQPEPIVETPTRRESIPADVTMEEPAARSTAEQRKIAAGAAIDRLLPSPRVVMIVLGTTGAVALLCAALAIG